MLADCWYNSVCSRKICNSGCVRYLEMKSLMEYSGIPKSRQTPIALSPDSYDYDAFCRLADIKDDIVEFVSYGKNLYLFSEYTGNGKTTWAIKLMLKYFDSIWAGNGFKCRGIFIHTPTFLNRLKNFKEVDEAFEHTKRLLPTVDLVVWDDIASTDMSAYDNSQLLSYIDQRILNDKSNIFTGNVGEEHLEKAVGTRLASRIWNTSEVIKFYGKDKR